MIFYDQLISDKILGLELCFQMLPPSQISWFFKMSYLKKEANYELYFWHTDQNRSLLGVGTIYILVMCNQAYPK